ERVVLRPLETAVLARELAHQCPIGRETLGVQPPTAVEERARFVGAKVIHGPHAQQPSVLQSQRLFGRAQPREECLAARLGQRVDTTARAARPRLDLRGDEPAPVQAAELGVDLRRVRMPAERDGAVEALRQLVAGERPAAQQREECPVENAAESTGASRAVSRLGTPIVEYRARQAACAGTTSPATRRTSSRSTWRAPAAAPTNSIRSHTALMTRGVPPVAANSSSTAASVSVSASRPAVTSRCWT